MKSRNATALTLIALLSLFVLSCAGGVSLTHVWNNPGYSGGPVNNILVVGLAPKQTTRITFEYELKNQLSARGVVAQASIDGIPRGTKLDEETFKQYYGDKGIGAVFVTGLVSADTVEQYIPGHTYVQPIGYYNTWHGYYSTVYTVYDEPGYWTSSAEFVIESNLYDVNSGKLIWRGVSKAVDPDNALDVVHKLTTILVDQLAKDGLITDTSKK